MEYLKIERGIEQPKTTSKNPVTLLVLSMEVGDSIFVKHEDNHKIQAAITHARYKGMRISMRTQEDGIRYWRIK